MGYNVDVNAFRKLIGQTVPALPFLNVSTGQYSSLDNYIEKNKVAVLVFWSTRCCGCPDSLDVLDKLATKDQFVGNVVFLAVNINNSEISKSTIEHWTNLDHLYVNEENNNKFVRGDFGVKFLPHCTIIDQNGVVVQNGGNFYVDRASVEKQVTKLLNTPVMA